MLTTTWLNVLNMIDEKFSCAKQIQSAVRRTLLMEDGLALQGKRVTKQELNQINEALSLTSLPRLSKEEWEQRLETALDKSSLTDDQKRSPRHYCKKFINFIVEKQLVKVTIPAQKIVVKDLFLKRAYPDLVANTSCYQKSEGKKYKQPRFALHFNPEFYLSCYHSHFPDAKDEDLIQLVEQELQRIQGEMDDCIYFLGHRNKDPLSSPSQKNFRLQTRRLLGAQFIHTQDLSKVGLTSLVKVVSTRLNIEDFSTINEYLIAQGRSKQAAEKAADETIDGLNQFFSRHGKFYKSTGKSFYVDALVNIAKFLYVDITDNTQFSNYQDIPVINKLNVFRQNLPKAPQVISDLPITYEEAFNILLELKKRVDNSFDYVSRSNGKITRSKRSKKGVAKDTQKLLKVAVIVIIPPLRARTLAKLEFGQTIKCGLRDDKGFIPKDLLPNPSDAKYYYDMKDIDYKTGKVYGDYFSELPNLKFNDGTCFYDYLNRWFFDGYRDSLIPEHLSHNFMFVCPNKGKYTVAGQPAESVNYSSSIYSITRQYTGIEIGPHAFRHIFRTHIANMNPGDKVLDSLAHTMQHSPEIAEKAYTFQDAEQKTAPIIDLINSDFLNFK